MSSASVMTTPSKPRPPRRRPLTDAPGEDGGDARGVERGVDRARDHHEPGAGARARLERHEVARELPPRGVDHDGRAVRRDARTTETGEVLERRRRAPRAEPVHEHVDAGGDPRRGRAERARAEERAGPADVGDGGEIDVDADGAEVAAGVPARGARRASGPSAASTAADDSGAAHGRRRTVPPSWSTTTRGVGRPPARAAARAAASSTRPARLAKDAEKTITPPTWPRRTRRRKAAPGVGPGSGATTCAPARARRAGDGAAGAGGATARRTAPAATSEASARRSIAERSAIAPRRAALGRRVSGGGTGRRRRRRSGTRRRRPRP